MHYAPHIYNFVSRKRYPQRSVNYYNFNNSNVFVLVLDASKAFDKVNYCK